MLRYKAQHIHNYHDAQQCQHHSACVCVPNLICKGTLTQHKHNAQTQRTNTTHKHNALTQRTNTRKL